jgi:nucleotide-binding universal stress UspA family protein
MVPVDGSPLAEQAIPYAIAIAKRGHSKVRLVLVREELPLVMVAEPAAYSRTRLLSRRWESAYLRALSVRVQEQLGHRVSCVALEGEVIAALSEYVRDSAVDLVVMTTHGRGGLQRAWLASVADELVRTLDVPVLTLRGQEGAPLTGPHRIQQILVPLDGSPLAEAALAPAAKMARLWKSQLSLLSVVHPVLLSTDSQFLVPAIYDAELTQRLCEAARADLERLAEDLRQQGVQAKAVVLVAGSTAASILELAHPDQVGMIALATHGRGGLKRVALGSVADKLVRSATVPVLVIRPGSLPQEKAAPISSPPGAELHQGQRRARRPTRVSADSETRSPSGRKP